MLHLVGCLYYLYQWCTVKQISDNAIYLLIKYIKSVLWRVAKRLSYIEDARCLKVKEREFCINFSGLPTFRFCGLYLIVRIKTIVVVNIIKLFCLCNGKRLCLRKETVSFGMSACLIVRTHGTNWLLPDRFSWNLIFEYFSKLC